MEYRMSRAPLRALMGGLLFASLLSACGGGGGLSSETVTGSGPGTGTGTGSIGITLGDSPVDDFDEINITVSRVELLGGETDVVLSDETITVDLLALDAATELLLVADDVPAGQYAKIRLQVDRIELVRLDADGNVDGDPVEATLLANGKIDLNPRGTFNLTSGGTLIVQLDLDARRSFQAVRAGTGQIRFRPVVFVDVLGDADLRRITFLAGNIARLALPEGETAFELCNARRLTGRGPGDRQLAECRPMNLVDGSAVFDPDADPIDFQAVSDNAPAVVAGRLVAGDEGLGFEALVVQLGDRSDFKRITGRVAEGAVDGDFRLVDASAPEEQGIDVTVQPGALLFDQHGAILEVAALAAGTEVRAMGRLLAAEDMQAPRLLATAIAVMVTEGALEEVAGTITNIDGDRFELALDGGDSACVQVTSDTAIQVVGDDGEAASSAAGGVDALEEGRRIEVRGERDDGCVTALELIVETEAAEG